MSRRNIKKLQEQLKNNKDDAPETLEDFEPHFSQTSKTTFSGLEINLSDEEDSANDHANGNSSDTSEGATAATAASTSHRQNAQAAKKKKRRNGKKNKNKTCHVEADDEIDQMVAEVNMMLGAPQAASSKHSDEAESLSPVLNANSKTINKISVKHLNVENELFRLFGPDEDAPKQRHSGNVRFLRRQIIQPNPKYTFSVPGIKMTLTQVREGEKIFMFKHSPEYQSKLENLIPRLLVKYYGARYRDPEPIPVDTIEAAIENIDLFFSMYAIDASRPSVEEIIYFYQGIFHPKFIFTDEDVRLPYLYINNRPFHIIMLKYIHMLTNKACHRTALELAKLLLNLDPSDPLGMILILDVLALRAREHQWLIDYYKMWEEEKYLKHLFHMRYSYALATFHVATKNNDSDMLKESDKLLQDAIVVFPYLIITLLNYANYKNESITNSNLFKNSFSKTSDDMKALMQMYANFIWPRYREPAVWTWFAKGLQFVTDRYETEPTFREYAENYAKRNALLFQKFPLQIKRHLNIITPMADYILEGQVPSVQRSFAVNPYPDQGEHVDTHNYYARFEMRMQSSATNEAFLAMFQDH